MGAMMIKKKRSKMISRIYLGVAYRDLRKDETLRDIQNNPTDTVEIRLPSNVDSDNRITIVRRNEKNGDVYYSLRQYYLDREAFDKFSYWIQNIVSGYCLNHPNCKHVTDMLTAMNAINDTIKTTESEKDLLENMLADLGWS